MLPLDFPFTSKLLIISNNILLISTHYEKLKTICPIIELQLNSIVVTCRPTSIQSPTTKRMLRNRVFEETLFLCLSYARDTVLEFGDNSFERQALHSIIPFIQQSAGSYNKSVFCNKPRFSNSSSSNISTCALNSQYIHQIATLKSSFWTNHWQAIKILQLNRAPIIASNTNIFASAQGTCMSPSMCFYIDITKRIYIKHAINKI